MNRVSCDVIRDLSLLYVDKACCNESRRLIEAHIADCESCKENLELIKQDFKVDQPNITENLTEQELFRREKSRRIGAIVIVLVLSFLLFLFIYKEEIFQEGNPLNYSKAFVKLIVTEDYVDISGTSTSSETTKFMTKRDDKEELFRFLEQKYGVKYNEQVGSAYIFRNDTSTMELELESYLKFFTVWEVGELRNKK